MGQEINRVEFSSDDFNEFYRRLRQETHLLCEWLDNDVFLSSNGVCGFELEACIVDKNYLPAMKNNELLNKVDSLLLVPELAKFNIEFNSNPQTISEKFLRLLHDELKSEWTNCRVHAREMNNDLVAIGILPTLQNEIICMDSMSTLQRFIALNNQLMELQDNQPIVIAIKGNDSLHLIRNDIMLEAAATSFQIHLQLQPKTAVRFYNASHILSAPMIAICGNSPYLFGKDLWYETRIPMFEQSISARHYCKKQKDYVARVTFGNGYLKRSIKEAFIENLISYPPLLPIMLDSSPEWLSHARLHNGTIWRWNRPIIGMNMTGKPHIRLEHRIASASPSITDSIANIAFFIGSIYDLAQQEIPPETQLPFHVAKENFYAAAKHGLNATIRWTNGRHMTVETLLVESLIPRAKESLLKLGVLQDDVRFYLMEVLLQRIQSKNTGSNWQRKFVERHGADFQEMTHAYCDKQKRDLPICQWKI